MAALAIVLDGTGDAEIQQMCPPCGIHQHVARLDVAMHDQLFVRMCQRGGNLPEHVQTRGKVGVGIAQPRVQAHAGDVIGHQIGTTLGCGAGVQQAHDAWMMQSGQQAALGFDAFAQRRVVIADEFDRDLLLEQAIGTFAQPDLSHAAAPEQA